MTMPAEVAALATNLARNCRYAVFPVRSDKKPACPHWFRDASLDPVVIAELWRRYPAPLIGIATGSRSGISVLDIDQKHPEAVVWWQESHSLLLPSRTYVTRSGGLHVYFRHHGAVTNTQGRLCRGVDTRGEAGYIISWFASGLECFDYSPPAPWPAWLLDELRPRPTPLPSRPARTVNPDRALDGIVRRLAASREGERNGMLYWAACRCTERGMRLREIEALLLPTATSIGLPDIEARKTIGSGMKCAA
jgi:hypothetical protein